MKQWILHMFSSARAPSPNTLVRLAGWHQTHAKKFLLLCCFSQAIALCLWRHLHDMLPVSFVLLTLDGCGSLIVLRQSQRWNYHQSYQSWLSLLKTLMYYFILFFFSRLRLGELGQYSHTENISVNRPTHNMSKSLRDRAKPMMGTLWKQC